MQIDTPRTAIDRFTNDDAEFILRLLNEPSFIENIADKGVRNLDDAREYLHSGPIASYKKHGFGLWRVALRESDEPIGMCGLLQRDFLEHPDIGYALLPKHCGQGLAYEACTAVMGFAANTLKAAKVYAFVSDHNQRSIHLLDKLGFAFERELTLPDSNDEVLLYSIAL